MFILGALSIAIAGYGLNLWLRTESGRRAMSHIRLPQLPLVTWMSALFAWTFSLRPRAPENTPPREDGNAAGEEELDL